MKKAIIPNKEITCIRARTTEKNMTKDLYCAVYWALYTSEEDKTKEKLMLYR